MANRILPRNGMGNPFPIILRNVGYVSHRVATDNAPAQGNTEKPGKSIRTKLINLSLFNTKSNKIS